MATVRQRMAVKEIIDNHRPVSVAMRMVGYKPTTASVPYNLTHSDGWQKLIKKYLSDDKIIKKHNEALEATKPIVAGQNIVNTPDHQIRIKAVELAYKVKGRLSDNNVTVNNQTLIFDLGHNEAKQL